MESVISIGGLILDMDGVVWRDRQPIGSLPEIFARIHSLGLKVMLATNNATRTPEQYVEKLGAFGVDIPPEWIVNSALAAAYLLKNRFPQGGAVYVIGEAGICRALQEAGFHLLDDWQADLRPLAVVVSMDRGINYQKLRAATLYIRAGAEFYATNPDRTFPTPAGLAPGAGALAAAVSAAVGRLPVWAGKPEPFMLQMCLERMGLPPEQTLVVGDRLETDIAGGQAAGCRTALVLSGVASLEQAQAWQPPVDVVAKDLTALLSSWPPFEI